MAVEYMNLRLNFNDFARIRLEAVTPGFYFLLFLRSVIWKNLVLGFVYSKIM